MMKDEDERMVMGEDKMQEVMANLGEMMLPYHQI